MKSYSKLLLTFAIATFLVFPSLALADKTAVSGPSAKSKKHFRHKKGKAPNVKANQPQDPQTEVTDQREVSEQPGKSK